MRSFLAVIVFCFVSVASAAEPVDDARTKTLFSQLRCVVCQNQSIADSDAAVAADLRAIVRTKIADGATDAAIFDYLVERYGEFVLLKPRFRWNTFVLWGAPFLVFVLGVAAMVFARRKHSHVNAAELTEDEERRLEELLNNGSTH